MVHGFVSTVPKDMDEAGIVDGCTPWQLFLKIMFPLLKPILVTLFITQFVFVWNDFQMPLYLIQSSKNWTIVLGVYNFLGQYNSQWNMVCAYILLSSLTCDSGVSGRTEIHHRRNGSRRCERITYERIQRSYWNMKKLEEIFEGIFILGWTIIRNTGRKSDGKRDARADERYGHSDCADGRICLAGPGTAKK